jgi:basic membrane protein A
MFQNVHAFDTEHNEGGKHMKKVLSVLLCLGLAASLAIPAGADEAAGISKDDIKVGFIYVGDDTDQGYTSNFMDGTKELIEELGLREDQVIEKTNVSEDSACETALKELAEAGCNIIFATSFGFEDYVEAVAPDYPDIEFCHATGYQCATDDLENTHNYFPQIYQARYLTGIIAGLKTESNKLGYVAAMPFSEVISGYTAFYLGAKSVNPDVTMEVIYTNSWNDPNLESQAAQALCDDGCDVLGQHADSAATATVAEKNGKWQIAYNSDMIDKAPNASITGCRCDWGAFEKFAVNAVINGEEIPQDWTGGLAEEAVALTPFNDALMPEGAAEKLEEAKAAILDGSLNVFDTSAFTVGGEEMTSYVNDFDVEFIADGYFHEQDPEVGGSSPAFPSDWIVDGITVK